MKEANGSKDITLANNIDRRTFIKKATIATGAAVAGLSGFGNSITYAQEMKPDLVVASSGNPAQLLQAALSPLGGIKAFVKSGQRVLIKPNLGWARKPEEAATTNPDIIATLIKMCREAGAKDISLWDHTCDNYQFVFTLSKLKEVAQKNGASIYSAHGENVYVGVDIPKGKILKRTKIIKALQTADVIINVPIAKQHYATELTLGLKNMMGVVWDMVEFHRVNLHQAIADLNTLFKPNLIIMDAIRILIDNGPKGPGKVQTPNLVIAGKDPVAIDAYAAGLFKKPRRKGSDSSKVLPQQYTGGDVEFSDISWKPEEIPHIRMAHEHGLGEINLAKLNIKKV